MWDSLAEHVAVVVTLLAVLGGLVGWLIRLLLKRLIFDKFTELGKKIEESEGRMTQLVTSSETRIGESFQQKVSSLDERVTSAEKRFEAMRTNYLDRFESVHTALNATREDMIRATGETSAAILKAVMELRTYISDNFQRVGQ